MDTPLEPTAGDTTTAIALKLERQAVLHDKSKQATPLYEDALRLSREIGFDGEHTAEHNLENNCFLIDHCVRAVREDQDNVGSDWHHKLLIDLWHA